VASGRHARNHAAPRPYLGGSAAIWLRLQAAYDLARAEAELAAKIPAEVIPAAA
jgi:plasmid maintenance system antidote protein VapI